MPSRGINLNYNLVTYSYCVYVFHMFVKVNSMEHVYLIPFSRGARQGTSGQELSFLGALVKKLER